MYCKSCGKEIEDNAKFCKYCGKSQEDAPKQEKAAEADPMQGYRKTRLNTRILETLRKEFHIDPEKELKNFTSFHSQGYWGPVVGVMVCVILSAIVNDLRYARGIRLPALNVVLYIALFAFVVWLIILLLRIFRSAFGITETSLLVRIWPSESYDIPLGQIEKVDLSLPPLAGRSGYYGNLQITTKEKTYTFKSVSNVKNFKNTLDQQMKKIA